MRRMRGLKWGVLVGSVLMVLAVGPQPYWSENPTAFSPPLLLFWGFGLPVIAGIVAGAITRGSWRKNILAGTLCAIPATVVYWYVLEVAHIGDGLMTPVMALWAAGSGAIGGLVSYGIQSLKT